MPATEVACTLACGQDMTIFQRKPVYSMESTQANAQIDRERVGTLTARCYKDPPVVIEPFVIDRAAFNQGKNALYPPPYRADERDGHARCEGSACRYVGNSNGQGICGPICARDYKGVGNEYVAEGKVMLVEDEYEYVVRRLTPLECERLQGFPDGYTDIGGKVVRDKKSDMGWRIDRTKETPDSPRYKALGNSWAVPCAQFVFERLDEVDGF